LSDPAHPTLLGQVDMQAFPTLGPQLEVHGSLLYLWGSGGFTIVDMRDPNSPVMVANGMQESMNDLAITPDWIATTNGRDFRILPLQCQTPSPVELSSFEAAPVPGAIRITWRTAREWDHLGFHVERATDAAGNYARLTDLIPPPGPYAFLDQQVAPGVTYFYRLAAVDRGGRTDHYGPLPATALPAAHTAAPPLRNQLAQRHPNPFLLGDRETAITYSLATAGRARLRLFDATGRVVATLVDADLPAGEHTAIWNGQTVRGESVPAGTYFYRLEAGSYSDTRQLVRLR
ncbi:MAG TPA: FlgD immunoglobulin-like domain containing protein, partial [Candidatus Udaeobacter sp.]|nr:FlgD immunoglobulin-like domain containing protein [Candidatus Udaeobacter sp.]